MRIRNNIPGMRGLRYGKKVNNETSKTLEKLSSGYRINRAGDDAAGLAVSERIRACLTGYDRCEDNVREGINLASTADAALQEVNDMLCRAEELCVTAANGTYSQHERDQLLEELNALYDEMDRIFESSSFNETQLFRHEDGDYSNGHFEYLEEVIPTDPTNLQEWGALGDIDQVFGQAADAQCATATLTLDSDVQTAADLAGKSFEIRANDGSTYKVMFTTSGGNGITSDAVSGGYYYNVNVTGCTTVQDAFDRLCEASETWSTSWVSDHVVLDKQNTIVSGNTVTLAFQKTTLSQSITSDGVTKVYETPDGDGTKSNGVVISSSQELVLDPVDSTNNDFTVSATFQLIPGKADSDALTAEMKQKLLNNTLYVGGFGNPITFADGSGGGRVIDVSMLNTVGELRDTVAAAANTIDGVYVSAPADDGSVTIEHTNFDSSAAMIESTQGGSQNQTVTTNALSGITVNVQPAGAERAEVTVITLPGSYADTPFSINVNGLTTHFYNSADLPLGYKTDSYSWLIDINGKTPDEIQELIYSSISSRYSTDATVSRSGNTVTLTAKVVSKALDVQVEGVTGSFSIYPEPESVLLEPGSDRAYLYQYYQNYSVDLDISDAMSGGFDTSALTDSGFNLNGTWYQFVDNGSAGTLAGAVTVDISACGSYDDIADVLQTAIAASGGNTNVAVTNNGGLLTVSGTHSNTSSSALKFQDGRGGVDGLFGDAVGVTQSMVSGGTTVGNPTATINFGGYNKDNFRELYGKGFRVTCATCADEYINVIFCYDKAQSAFPDSFDITSGTGEVRTIHNLVVELKGMTSGSDIVQSIVTQLSPELDHYTGVAVGNPSSVLKVFDNRPGDRYAADGTTLQRAEILSGVCTNCIYTVKENFVPAPDDVVGDIEVDYRYVDIFADAESDQPYIEIHLPYLTLENLQLDPPKPDFSTPEKALETMERVLQANNAISSMRGTLGADFNRLEHAAANLTQAAVQASDAYSRIRDTDMADAMVEHTKLSILQSAQQAAQAHTLELPRQILTLIQS